MTEQITPSKTSEAPAHPLLGDWAINRKLEKLEKEYANNQRQLSNEQFLAKAPEKVVEGLRRRAQELASLLEKLKRQLNELNSPGTNS